MIKEKKMKINVNLIEKIKKDILIMLKNGYIFKLIKNIKQ